jgi:O-antigen/teichoic acid export membrane protein
VGDALATTAGQGLCIAASLVFSIFVPRLLGAANYGEWMLFRGLAIFWLSLLSLGDRELISSFYVPQREKGDADGASRIFKSLMAFRLALLPLGLAAALLMLHSTTSVYRTVDAALCLSATLVFKSLQCNLTTLIFGHRRLGWVAFLEVAQAVLLPLFVLLAFGDGQTEWIPRAAVAADAILFAMALAVSRLWREWRPGWVQGAALLEIVRYAGAISLAASVIVSLNNLLLYLMNIRGYSSAALGWVGLSTRCAWIVQAGLITVATALMPALAVVQVHHGAPRMLRWQNFLSRLGLSLLLLLAGNVLLLGPVFVTRIWGADYEPVPPLIVGSLLAVLPVWLGAQWIRQFLLQRSTRVYLQAATLYAIVLCVVFFLLPVDRVGWTPVIALVCAGWALAVHTAFHAARNGASLGWLLRFLPAVAWVMVAWLRMGTSSFTATGGVQVVAWNVLLAVWILLPRALAWHELADLWSLSRQRKSAGV